MTGTTTFNCGSIKRQVARDIEAADTNDHNFFRHIGKNYFVKIEPDRLNYDASYQTALFRLVRRFEEKAASSSDPPRGMKEAADSLRELREDMTFDMLEFDTAISPEKTAAIEALDNPTYDFFTPTGRTRKFDDQTYPISRVSLDLGLYATDAAYRAAFTTFAAKVKASYDTLLAKSGRTIDDVDNDLRNFYHFLNYPKIHFRIPLSEKVATFITRYDPMQIYLRNTGRRVGENLHLVQVEADLGEDLLAQATNNGFTRFATDLFHYYYEAMAERNLKPDNLDPDLRNLYSLMSAHAQTPLKKGNGNGKVPDAAAGTAPAQAAPGGDSRPSLLSLYPKGKTKGKLTIIRYDDDRYVLVARRGSDGAEVDVIPTEIDSKDYEVQVKSIYDRHRRDIDDLVGTVDRYFQGWKATVTVDVTISRRGSVRVSERDVKFEGTDLRPDIRKALVRDVKKALRAMPWPIADHRSRSTVRLVVEMISQVPVKTDESTGK